MSVRNILWTALPNGLNAAGNRLKLSVLVSPRLVTTNGSDGKLAEFPDFLDWPSVVTALHFRVEVQPGPTSTANPITEPAFPAPDSAAWGALFPRDTFVRSYAFDDRANAMVRSFPTRRVLAFLKEQYQT